MYKNIYDTPEEIEVSFSVSDTGLYRLPLGRMFTTYEIWTGAGKTGTQLIDNTDFIAGGTSARAGEIKGESVYTGFQITNAGYHSTTLYATIYWVGTLGNTETIFRDVGELKRFATYKDRTGSRLLPFAFDNAVSKSDYADLYDEVGDVFEAMHVAAGDSASAADEFYPTPIPGYYERTGLPDLTYASTDRSANALINITHHISRDGTPVKLIGDDIPAPLVSGTVYYVKVNSTTSISFATTESDAIAGTVITLTDAGSGTFRLTQEGVEIGDAFQGFEISHAVDASGTVAGAAYATGSRRTDLTAAPNARGYIVPDHINTGYGTPRTSNETRPVTLYEFGYIRY